MLAYQHKNSYQIIVKSVNLDRDSSRTGRAGLLAEQPDKIDLRVSLNSSAPVALLRSLSELKPFNQKPPSAIITTTVTEK